MNQQFLNDLPKDIKQAMSRAGTAGIGVHSARHGRLISEYYQLQTDGARGAFAIGWVKATSKTLNETWPVLYDLLRVINEREHYKNPQRTGGEVYESFQDFFERTVEQPFETWKELEDTYQFVRTNAPHLLEGTFEDAKKAFRSHGGDRRSDDFKINNVNFENAPKGNSAGYALRRLAKDAPELHALVLAGELSPNAAAIQAGFRKRKMQLPDDPQSAGRYLAERVDDEWMRAMFIAYEDACDAALAKEIREGVESGEIETVPWEEVEAGLRERAML